MVDSKSKISKVKGVLLDVDGVMTDGKLHYSSNGEEIKSFDVKDGLGIQLLQKANIVVGIISGRNSDALEKRAKELGIQLRYVGSIDKERDFREFLKTTGLERKEVAYIGDDLPDLATLKLCGFSACPSDACPEVLKVSDYICSKRGGEGVVREIAELVLRSTGDWTSVLREFQSE